MPVQKAAMAFSLDQIVKNYSQSQNSKGKIQLTYDAYVAELPYSTFFLSPWLEIGSAIHPDYMKHLLYNKMDHILKAHLFLALNRILEF